MEKDRYRILVCDDDREIVDAIEIYLMQEGYTIFKAYDGQEAIRILKEQQIHLLLIDIMMPKLDGIHATLKIREYSSVPIIFLSAKSEDTDKILGLNIGADDYVTKPFDTKELIARIAVQLRNAAVSGAGMMLEYRDIVMDTRTHSVYVCGEMVHLTRTEYAILKMLMQNPSQVITKTLLLERISEDTPDCMESSLRVHVSNLRRKLRDAGGKDYVESVWGIGFKLYES